MDECESLSHSKRECKYAFDVYPRKRRKVPQAGLRKRLGKMIHRLAEQKANRIEEERLIPGRVHMMISIELLY